MTLMFERYTDRARRVIVLADQAARDLGHDSVDTGHLLLGLLGEGEATAFRALDALGVTPEAAREAVLGRRPAEGAHPGGHRAFTPALKKALELGRRESAKLGCNYVAAEHLLLGLIAEGSDVGALALADCGIAIGDRGFLADVRAKVLELLDGYARPATEAAAQAGETTRQQRDRLAEYLWRIADGLGSAKIVWRGEFTPDERVMADRLAERLMRMGGRAKRGEIA